MNKAQNRTAWLRTEAIGCCLLVPLRIVPIPQPLDLKKRARRANNKIIHEGNK